MTKTSEIEQLQSKLRLADEALDALRIMYENAQLLLWACVTGWTLSKEISPDKKTVWYELCNPDRSMGYDLAGEEFPILIGPACHDVLVAKNKEKDSSDDQKEELDN